MGRGTGDIRIPSLWGAVGVIFTLVSIGLVVFLRRYRGADRTAMAFGLLVGAGICLLVALVWFQGRYGGRTMSRQGLRRLGIRGGAVAGGCTIGPTIGLLALRWGFERTAGLSGDPLLPASLQALVSLTLEMAWGLPVYMAIGAAVGALVGWGVGEAIGAWATPVAEGTPDA